MDNLQELKEYMEQMKIKKALFGGYSKEDVQLKFDMVYAMFEKAMKDQQKKEKSIIEDFERRLQNMTEEFENKKHMSDILIIDLNKSITNLTEEKEQIEKEQLEMKSAYKSYCENMLIEYKGALRALSGEFSRVLEDVAKIQKGLDEDTIFHGLEKKFEEKSQDAIPQKEEILDVEEVD